jgi:hypothetical protein
MIDSQVMDMMTAILTGIIIPPENLAAGQLDMWTGSFDHILQPDN